MIMAHLLTRNLGLGLLSVLLAGSGAVSVIAQDSSVTSELERLRRDMNTMQSYIFQGGKLRGTAPTGSIPEFASQDSVSQVQLQVQELRRRMREMSGQLEQIYFKVTQMAERHGQLVADVDVRLRALEAHRIANAAPSASELSVHPGSFVSPNPETGTNVNSSPGIGVMPSGDGKLRDGQKAFGVLSKTDLEQSRINKPPAEVKGPSAIRTKVEQEKLRQIPKPSAVPSPAPVAVAEVGTGSSENLVNLPQGTPKKQYDFAYGLLMKRELPKAELALKRFLDNHPEHELADNAAFWLGETFYARKNYNEAIRIYYDTYRKYPKGNKAPDVLLKLGMSLAKIGEKESACSAYGELINTHPSARPRVLGNAERSRKSLGCN